MSDKEIAEKKGSAVAVAGPAMFEADAGLGMDMGTDDLALPFLKIVSSELLNQDETIDAKLAAEKMQEVANMVNMRFGPNTWKEILEERARRIQEQKEHERQMRIQKAKEAKEFMDALKMIGMVVLSIIVIIGITVGSIYYSRMS